MDRAQSPHPIVGYDSASDTWPTGIAGRVEAANGEHMPAPHYPGEVPGARGPRSQDTTGTAWCITVATRALSPQSRLTLVSEGVGRAGQLRRAEVAQPPHRQQAGHHLQEGWGHSWSSACTGSHTATAGSETEQRCFSSEHYGGRHLSRIWMTKTVGVQGGMCMCVLYFLTSHQPPELCWAPSCPTQPSRTL